MIKHIPNTITLIGSFFGAISTAFAIQGHLKWACYAILIAAICDFADGFLARLLNAKSPLGVDLDSLSDVISFGMAPAAIAYKLLYFYLPNEHKIWAFVSFIIVPFSVLRLAIFNNYSSNKAHFEGLPVPANAMLWVGILFLHLSPTFPFADFFLQPIMLLFYIIIFSLLLVSKLPLFSFKFKGNKKDKNLIMKLVFFLISACLLIYIGFIGLFFIIIIYVLSGIITLILKQ